MKVVVTIPAFNEENTIGKIVEDIRFTLPCKVLVIDDGSRDSTAAVARKAGAIVISHPTNLGLAETFKSEMKAALKLNPDIIVHTDADGQYRAAEIPRLIKPIQDRKADLVLGSRFRGTIEDMPLLKRWGNEAFSSVISNIANQRITDSQTGFRAFTKEVAELPIISNHTYTQEQVIKAVKQKFRVVEVPVYFAKRHDRSRLIRNPFEYAAKAWINILRIYRDFEPLKFFGMIGGLFILFGTVIGIWIIVTLMQTGGVGGIPRVILSALFIMAGVQIMLFGFLADMRR